ncbi:hypothetical protein QW060_26665 [Myroides ceti]|uniref:Uncharacterized protein n=1 Tax=Paenimyroides ceti TaxID=395087 RepID=A0ABT8D0Q9_9FLAO|nr:hypothetical protein [Paenimyroides ceti]MDN3710405.1 hypothetical protein [Paenimyroides ceti]
MDKIVITLNYNYQQSYIKKYYIPNNERKLQFSPFRKTLLKTKTSRYNTIYKSTASDRFFQPE